MTQIHRPARLATRAASFRSGGRHHSGIPGDIIPLYPGDFVGIRNQGASLQDVTLLGAKQMTEAPKLWVEAASSGLGLPEDQLLVWEAALRGLVAAGDWTLHQVAAYVFLTREAIAGESKPLLAALGWALPALQLPRDSGSFLSIRPKDQSVAGRWKKLLEKLVTDRRPLLVKQRPPRQVIESEELRTQFESVQDEIPSHAHNAIRAFIEAPPNWRPEAAALAELEWEADGVFQVFTGLKKKKTSLPEETLLFFEFELPERLSGPEKEYLNQLKNESHKEPRDDDRDFFEAHREELGRDRSLRAKWERFIFGRPIECTDFLEGLLRALERLYGQAGALGSSRSLDIRVGRKSKSQWLELNADVATAFSLRYRGLPALMGKSVKWETTHLFDYEALLETAAKRKKYKRNVSTSRTSLQIKFDITLNVGDGALADKTTVQLIWVGRPNVIGLELRDDLDRLAKRPMLRSRVARQPVSRKGSLQAVSLSEVGTLQPAYRQDSGSLVPKSDAAEDLGKAFPKSLKAAALAGRITADGVMEIARSWDRFVESYSAAINGWRTAGLADVNLLQQAERYGELLETLSKHALGDLNRQELWEPVLALGCVEITGAAPSAIIAPWHPLRLAASAVKARGIAGLTSHLLTASDVNFGDSRLFFADLRAELAHPYYPEVAVGYHGAEPVLLVETGTINNYSLMERPVRDPSESATDVDPAEASQQIRNLLARYLDLQPHERSNLSIMLYNCDAAGLPLATINALGSVHDEDEMHCNVLVRHRDRPKLSRVYSELLEQSEGDPDALVVSETSRNFMSKLRIGVMLDGGGPNSEYRTVDVAFLHDVVSRQAKEAWFSVPATANPPSILDHVPARWSYRRVTAEDELKATSYLACPRQPVTGWAYLDAVAAVIQRQAGFGSEHTLPARQISFQDQALKSMFSEVHELADWVATYDDLLDKRQLAAQGINVIRYRRQRTHGRNMIVSSTSELRLLHVLVRRRLSELSLGLPDDRLSSLSQRLIDDACNISGDIVLRAARRGVSAGELIGLVLSRALVAEEFGAQASVAWFLLDDYAEWLGQREEGIADLLGLSVGEDISGHATLRAVVTEAKYVSIDASAEACRTSKQQLRQTVQRIEDALFGDPGRLDRDLWLSRIADLLLDGTTALGHSKALEAVRDGIRQGATSIDLRGYSHIFVAGPAAIGTVAGEQESISGVHNGIQEVFSREDVRNLLKAYEARMPLAPARSKLGDLHPWSKSDFRKPAPRVNWTSPTSIASPKARTVAISTPSAAEAPSVSTTPETVTEPAQAPNVPVSPMAADQVPAPPIAAKPTTNDIASLIETHALQRTSDTESDNVWLESTAQKLRSALLGYGFQAKILGTRLTPNAALIRFMGSDRLSVENIEGRQSALLTTHGLRLVAISL